MLKIAVIPGDGIGPEVIEEAVKVLNVVSSVLKFAVDLKYFDFGAEYYLKNGIVLPEEAKEELAKFSAILLGAVGDPRVPSGILEKELLLELRFHFDQFINLRPVKLLSAEFCPLRDKTEKDIDFVVVRENTEGLYVGVGGFFKKGTPDEVATQLDINTYKGVSRIIDYAFRLAKKRKKRVVMSDKSNVLTFGHNLWQRVFEEKKREYPDITANHIFIDALCMQMIKNPAQFDVIVTSNMFGDIITDLGAQIQGGMGLAAAGNINPEGLSMFEPVHGSAPKYAGKKVANPIAAILSMALMLEQKGKEEGAKIVEQAVIKTLKDKVLPRELGGTAKTNEIGDYISKIIKEKKQDLNSNEEELSRKGEI